MTSASVRSFIDVLAKCNPSGDRHGLMDTAFCESCASFAKRHGPGAPTEIVPENPLTLEEWAGYRESEDCSAAYSRENNAMDPWVFLFVLRDELVFTAGASPVIIKMISDVIDPVIHRTNCEWITPSGRSPLEGEES